MRKLHLLSTVAASLLLATGVAVAQGMKDETPARAPAAQQNAPAEKTAPSMHAGERKGKAGTTGQASEKMEKLEKGRGMPSLGSQSSDFLYYVSYKYENLQGLRTLQREGKITEADFEKIREGVLDLPKPSATPKP